MKNLALNTLDATFSLAEAIEQFDYVALGRSVVDAAATATAVVVGLFSYFWLALQLFWDDHGETVTVGLTRFAFGAVDLAGSALLAGRALRRLADRWVPVATDRLYLAAAGMV